MRKILIPLLCMLLLICLMAVPALSTQVPGIGPPSVASLAMVPPSVATGVVDSSLLCAAPVADQAVASPLNSYAVIGQYSLLTDGAGVSPLITIPTDVASTALFYTMKADGVSHLTYSLSG